MNGRLGEEYLNPGFELYLTGEAIRRKVCHQRPNRKTFSLCVLSKYLLRDKLAGN